MRDAPHQDRGLDEAVALDLLSYRWVRWKEDVRFVGPSERGRFLAPPKGLLAHLQVPAGLEVPLAKDPYRYLPAFSTDAGFAMELAERTGLLQDGGTLLTVSPEGRWMVLAGDREGLGEGDTLPEAVCRACLNRFSRSLTRAAS